MVELRLVASPLAAILTPPSGENEGLAATLVPADVVAVTVSTRTTAGITGSIASGTRASNNASGLLDDGVPTTLVAETCIADITTENEPKPVATVGGSALCGIGGGTVAAGSQEARPLVGLDTPPSAAALLALPWSLDCRRAESFVAPAIALVIGSSSSGADDDSNEMIAPAIESAVR